MRNKGAKENKFLLWVLSILLFLSLFIIGYSVYLKQVPNDTSKYLWSKVTGKNYKLAPSVDSLLFQISIKDNLIDSLQTSLKKYEKINIHKKALVDVEQGTLNMRSEPQLVSSIIAKIPDSSLVDVLYFDTKVYYLGGKSGRWCKIKYADQDGWVWGGFIKIQKD